MQWFFFTLKKGVETLACQLVFVSQTFAHISIYTLIETKDMFFIFSNNVTHGKSLVYLCVKDNKESFAKCPHKYYQ